jgi:serine/threonine-protein kinase RsbW
MTLASEDAIGPVELSIESHPANLACVRRAIETLGSTCGFDDAVRSDIGLCVNEALANIIRHAYHGATDRPIAIRAEFVNEALRITIRDWGNGVNPVLLRPGKRDPLKPGGVGMICLRKLMDEVEFVPQADGMLLTMTRKRTGGKAPAQTARHLGEEH